MYNKGPTNHGIKMGVFNNANFLELCVHKPRKCTKPDNSQNLNICCSKNSGRFLVSKIKISH